MIYRNRDDGFIGRFCARHPRFGIPNLMLYVIIGQVFVFLVDWLTKGQAVSLLYFNAPAILHGQVWRLVTFLFVPCHDNPFFFALTCYVWVWTGRMLEREWGSARFSLFYLSGTVLTALVAMLASLPQLETLEYVHIVDGSLAYYLNLSIFLCIATVFSEAQVLLAFVVPIKMKWAALIDVVLVAVSVIEALQFPVKLLVLILAPLASFINYFIFTWPFWSLKLGIVRRRADPRVINFKQAQKQARKKAQETGGYLHKCAVCGLTDQEDPNMEFRYCSKCDGYFCYCANHINNHVHIRKD